MFNIDESKLEIKEVRIEQHEESIPEYSDANHTEGLIPEYSDIDHIRERIINNMEYALSRNKDYVNFNTNDFLKLMIEVDDYLKSIEKERRLIIKMIKFLIKKKIK